MTNHFFGRGPKIACPMRTYVAPSCTAGIKSMLVPIDRSLKYCIPKRRARCSESRRRRTKYGRLCSGSSARGGIVIEPLKRKFSRARMLSISGVRPSQEVSSQAANPCLLSSPLMLNSINTGSILFWPESWRSSFCASRRLSS